MLPFCMCFLSQEILACNLMTKARHRLFWKMSQSMLGLTRHRPRHASYVPSPEAFRRRIRPNSPPFPTSWPENPAPRGPRRWCKPRWSAGWRDPARNHQDPWGPVAVGLGPRTGFIGSITRNPAVLHEPMDLDPTDLGGSLLSVRSCPLPESTRTCGNHQNPGGQAATISIS